MSMEAAQAPITAEQSEANKIISRLFAVAAILARGQDVPEPTESTVENCPEKHDIIALQYRVYEHSSTTND